MLNDFGFLHQFLGNLKGKAEPGAKKRAAGKKGVIPANLKEKFRKVKKIIRQKKVRYGLKKFAGAKGGTVINKEKIKRVNGKTIKEVEMQTIKREQVEASNKLPLARRKSRKRKLSGR